MSARRNRLGLMYLQLKGTFHKIFFPQRAQTFSMDTWHVFWSLRSNGHSERVQPYTVLGSVNVLCLQCHVLIEVICVLLRYRELKPLLSCLVVTLSPGLYFSQECRSSCTFTARKCTDSFNTDCNSSSVSLRASIGNERQEYSPQSGLFINCCVGNICFVFQRYREWLQIVHFSNTAYRKIM